MSNAGIIRHRLKIKAIIANAKEKRTAQPICKSAYTLQPTFRLILFKHQLEIVCSTFCYQSFYIHTEMAKKS